MPYQEDAEKILMDFLERLSRREKKEFLLIGSKWKIVEDAISDQIDELSNMESLTEAQLYKLSVYTDLLQEAKKQVNNFSLDAADIISKEQKIYGKAGIDVIQDALELKVKFFQHIPVDAVNVFVGFSQDGSPLYELLKKSYPETVIKLTNTLLKGVALGYNPTKTARLMKDDLGSNLKRALRIARTESMRTFREASRLQLKNSGVCDGYIRIEQDDCCPTCREVNGKHYGLDQEFLSHPNCRGGLLPDV